MKTKITINKIFIKILVSYLVVLMFPLIFIGIIYSIAGNAIRSNIIETNQALLTQSMKAIENKFYNMRRAIINFSRQPALINFVNSESTDISFITKAMNLRESMDNVKITNDIVDKIYIYSNHSMTFFSESGLSDINKFTESHYKNDSVNAYNLPVLLADSQMGRFLPLRKITQTASPADQATNSNQIVAKDQITFLQKLPVALSKQYDGAVIVLLNTSSITEMLNSGLLAGGTVAVLDENGKKLVEIIGTTYNSDGSNYTISYNDILTGDYSGPGKIVTKVVSPTTKWTYITAMPEHAVLATLNSVGQSVMILMAAMIFVGIILILYLTRYNALPFTKISKIMYGLYDDGMPLANRDQYGNFVDAISRLVSSNKELHSALSEQTDLLTYSFFNRLLSGNFDNNNDIYAFLSRLNLSFDGNTYVVVIFRFFPDADQNGIQMVGTFNDAFTILSNAAKELLHGKVFFHKQDIGNIMLVCNPYYNKSDSERSTLINDSMNILYNHLRYSLHVNFHMAVGGYYASIKDVAMSAKEAQRALTAHELSKDQPVLAWYDDRQNRDSGLHPYSLVFEQHLLNQISIRNRAKVKELLEGFYTSNIIKRKLSYKTLDLIKHELVSTLIRAMQETGYSQRCGGIIDDINFDNPIDVFFGKVTAAAMSLCEGSDTIAAEETAAPIADLLIAYIQKHRADPDLNYVSICEHFKISRYHLNKHIQGRTGIGFTDYLENLRMETAVRLLEETAYSIHEIASKAGYQNDKTFRRAFKRSFGYSPSDRRLIERVSQGKL